MKSGSQHNWYYEHEGVEMRSIITHPDNDRQMRSHVLEIAASFRDNGLVAGVSGLPWLQWSMNSARTSALNLFNC